MAPREKSLAGGGTKQTFEWLPVGDLAVDPKYQRCLDRRGVDKIAREFDPDLVGVFTISRRDSGEEVILDGQHRQAAILDLWGEHERVPCQVFHGLSREREAKLFADMNVKRVRPHTVDVYIALLAAKDPETVAIDRIIRKNGLAVNRNLRRAGAIRSPETLRRIFKGAGPEILDRTLDLLVKAGHADEEPLAGEVILGTAVVLSRYAHVIDEKRLYKILEANPSRRLLAAARTLRIEVRVEGDVGTAVARIVWDRYNRGRRVAGRVLWVDVPSGRYWDAIPDDRLNRIEDGD